MMDLWLLVEIVAVGCTFASLGKYPGVEYVKGVRCLWVLGLAYIFQPLLHTGRALLGSFKSFSKKFILVILFVVIYACPSQFLFRGKIIVTQTMNSPDAGTRTTSKRLKIGPTKNPKIDSAVQIGHALKDYSV